MPRLYSNDLRWRAIWMVELLGYSVDEVAATLFMSPRTIERYISKLLSQDKRLSGSYGYSPVGTRATVKRQAQNWGPRITAIPIICMEGMVEVGIYQGNVDGARFEEFVDQKLCPNLLPFNGVNPRSVVIMGKVKLFVTPT